MEPSTISMMEDESPRISLEQSKYLMLLVLTSLHFKEDQFEEDWVLIDDTSFKRNDKEQ